MFCDVFLLLWATFQSCLNLLVTVHKKSVQIEGQIVYTRNISNIEHKKRFEK